jgi:LPS export ABC transporter protein LptC
MLMSQDPYFLDLDLGDTNSPAIEFFNIKEYKLDKDGIKVEASAGKAERFKDKDVLYDISVSMMQNGSTQTLKSNNATLIGDIIYLNGDVLYSGNATIVTTEAVEYHQNGSMLVGKKPFKIQRDNLVAHGSSFLYYVKLGKLNLYDIKAVVQMEER